MKQIDNTSNKVISPSDALTSESKVVSFSIEGYKTFSELPCTILNTLPYAVYIIDYSWTYIFLNDFSKTIFKGDLTGKSALDVFRAGQFQHIFEAIREGVEKKFATSNKIYSPLRGQQVLIKGIPLEDCYFFSALTLPGKDELLDELRTQLKRTK